MPNYDYKNKETGEVVTVNRSVDERDTPPDLPGEWERVINLGGTSKGKDWGLGKGFYGREHKRLN